MTSGYQTACFYDRRCCSSSPPLSTPGLQKLKNSMGDFAIKSVPVPFQSLPQILDPSLRLQSRNPNFTVTTFIIDSEQILESASSPILTGAGLFDIPSRVWSVLRLFQRSVEWGVGGGEAVTGSKEFTAGPVALVPFSLWSSWIVHGGGSAPSEFLHLLFLSEGSSALERGSRVVLLLIGSPTGSLCLPAWLQQSGPGCCLLGEPFVFDGSLVGNGLASTRCGRRNGCGSRAVSSSTLEELAIEAAREGEERGSRASGGEMSDKSYPVSAGEEEEEEEREEEEEETSILHSRFRPVRVVSDSVQVFVKQCGHRSSLSFESLDWVRKEFLFPRGASHALPSKSGKSFQEYLNSVVVNLKALRGGFHLPLHPILLEILGKL
ncbi:hypothetical protein V2J09_021092 [Rumex salicifolius]